MTDKKPEGFRKFAALAKRIVAVPKEKVDAKMAQERLILTESQLAALEKAKADKECESACNFDPLSRGIGVQI